MKLKPSERIAVIVVIALLIYFSFFTPRKSIMVTETSSQRDLVQNFEKRATEFILGADTYIWRDTLKSLSFTLVKKGEKVTVPDFKECYIGYYLISYLGFPNYIHSESLASKPQESGNVKQPVTIQIKGGGGFLFGMTSSEVTQESNNRGFIHAEYQRVNSEITSCKYKEVSIGDKEFDFLQLVFLNDSLFLIAYTKYFESSLPGYNYTDLDNFYEVLKQTLSEKWGPEKDYYNYDPNDPNPIQTRNRGIDWGGGSISLKKYGSRYNMNVTLVYIDKNHAKIAGTILKNKYMSEF